MPNPVNYVQATPDPTGVLGPATKQPYYVRDPQRWAIEQEYMRHNQALYLVGEYGCFILMWHIQDFQAGLVNRCSTCWLANGKIAEAYGQTAQNKCPDCFGTTFEGGYRAIIMRPAIFSDTDEGEQFSARGVVHSQDVSVDSTTDFRVRTGDYVFRQNNDRYFLRVPNRITVRAGFQHPTQTQTAIGYNHARASVEDPTSVAYLIPPSDYDLDSILSMTSQSPVDFSPYEVIRAPLIPVNDP